jgi:hypothetical protein
MLEWLQNLEASGFPWMAYIIKSIIGLYTVGILRIGYEKITKKPPLQTLMQGHPVRGLLLVAGVSAFMLAVSYEVDVHAAELAKLCQKLGYIRCEPPATH